MYSVMRSQADPERLPDRELLAAIASRDGEAFTAFYRRHLPTTVSYLWRETHDPEAVADLTAEVFASIIVAARRYRPQTETAIPWVLGIARNVLGSSRRRGRVEDRARQRLGFEPIEVEDSDLERTEEIAGQGRITRLVEMLPSHERHAVTARIVDERSYREIAAEVRCSEMVVRKRVSRGLSRLRQRLEGDG
jgi:RNA polymerase sigma factor (sigma-70 family)